jgi:hypothetical protein
LAITVQNVADTNTTFFKLKLCSIFVYCLLKEVTAIMGKTYVIRIEIFNASDKEYKLLKKYMKESGFKKVSNRGTFWEISKAIKADTDLPQINRHIMSLLEKIDHSKVKVTTEFETPGDD